MSQDQTWIKLHTIKQGIWENEKFSTELLCSKQCFMGKSQIKIFWLQQNLYNATKVKEKHSQLTIILTGTNSQLVDNLTIKLIADTAHGGKYSWHSYIYSIVK